MRPTVQRIFIGVGSHGSVGSIDYICMSVNLVPTPTIGEDVLRLFGFICVIGRPLCAQSRRLKANISFPTCEKETSAMNTNFGA